MSRTYTEHTEYAVRRDYVEPPDEEPTFITETYLGNTMMLRSQAVEVMRVLDGVGRKDCYHTLVQRKVLTSEWKMAPETVDSR